mgnify:FL=1
MLDKDEFLSKYKLTKAFESSGLEWDTLQRIYDNYNLIESDLKKVKSDLEKYLTDNLLEEQEGSYRQQKLFHSVRCRIKSPEHLIEKIIRKRGVEHNYKYKEINENNYTQIIHDIIGVRVLVFKKEEWERIFDKMVILFPSHDENNSNEDKRCMAERPVAYTRYGDRDIFKNKIHAEHSNKGYRSQHYVVRFEGFYCEIQVRTLAEEVYGEFDHRVKYPYRNDNNFLKRYTNTLSQLLDAVDELISTCEQMNENGWDKCSEYYEEDKYIDWKNISQYSADNNYKTEIKSQVNQSLKHVKINAEDYMKKRLLRKD